MHTRPTHALLLRFLLVALAAGSPSAAVLAQDALDLPEVAGEALLAHLRLLASEEWEGRGTGTPGETKATDYIANHLAKLGLEPAGEQGTFFQVVPMTDGFDVGKECALSWTGAEGAVELFDVGQEFTPFEAAARATAEAPVLFAGYGITVPEAEYDDYAGVDPRGTIVVVFRHAPRIEGQGGRGAALFRRAAFTAKLEEATKRGALGLIVINDPFHFPGKPEEAAPGSRGLRDQLHRGSVGGAAGTIPFAHLTLAAGRRLLKAAFDLTPEALDAALHPKSGASPAPQLGNGLLRLATDVTPRFIHGRNVCALLRAAGEGASPDEVIVVGAHHDHLGRGASGTLARTPEERRQIHNGADDNGSGTSGLLEVARALASKRETMRRSILFLTFTGEERGLLGSLHWTANPTIPLARVAAMVNMDMIGRLDGRKLFVGGVKTSPSFRPILEELSPMSGLETIFGDGGRAPSDNTSFYARQIPVLFFFTGLHDDYHRPSDDIEKIDIVAMTKVARLAAGTSLALARATARPVFQRADEGGSGPPRAVLGIQVAAGEGGVKIGGMSPEGAAAKAGLRAGDLILSIDGEKTPDIGALSGLLRKREVGAAATLVVLRDGETLAVEAILGQG